MTPLGEDPRAFRLRDGRRGIVRRAVVGDAPVLMENLNSIAQEKVYIATDRPLTDLGAEEKWIQSFDGVDRVLYVAEVEGRVVGAADVRSGHFEKEAHVKTLGISIISQYRGMGVGTELMRACIDFCRSAGTEKVCLEVFATNVRAIALYEKLGFATEGVRAEQFKIDGRYVDEVLMALWLRPHGPPRHPSRSPWRKNRLKVEK